MSTLNLKDHFSKKGLKQWLEKTYSRPQSNYGGGGFLRLCNGLIFWSILFVWQTAVLSAHLNIYVIPSVNKLHVNNQFQYDLFCFIIKLDLHLSIILYRILNDIILYGVVPFKVGMYQLFCISFTKCRKKIVLIIWDLLSNWKNWTSSQLTTFVFPFWQSRKKLLVERESNYVFLI